MNPDVNHAFPGWPIFGTVFGVIFLAQLPGKSALTALVLSSRHRPFPVLAGAGLALATHAAIAVAAGGLLSFLPARPIHVAAGILFMMSAVVMWRGQTHDGERLETVSLEGSTSFIGHSA